MTQDENFKTWWHNEGSQAPYTHHDCEEHTMRMCEIAWKNAVYKEREACAKVCESEWGKGYRDDGEDAWLTHDNAVHACAAVIRARNEA